MRMPNRRHRHFLQGGGPPSADDGEEQLRLVPARFSSGHVPVPDFMTAGVSRAIFAVSVLIVVRTRSGSFQLQETWRLSLSRKPLSHARIATSGFRIGKDRTPYVLDIRCEAIGNRLGGHKGRPPSATMFWLWDQHFLASSGHIHPSQHAAVGNRATLCHRLLSPKY